MNPVDISRRPDRGREAGAAGAGRNTSAHATAPFRPRSVDDVSNVREDLFTGTARWLGMALPPRRRGRRQRPPHGLAQDLLTYMRVTLLAPCPECGSPEHLRGECVL